MKLSFMLVLPLVSLGIMTAIRAEEGREKVEIKEKNEHGNHEFKMKVERRGDHYVGHYNNREYAFRGDGATRFTNDGEYVVRGDIGADNTYIETREVQPVVVTERVEVGGNHEWKMRVVRKGDRYVGYYNDREYVLRGDAATHISADGEYTVHGDIGADQTYIETREVRPTVVVVEKKEPLIKIKLPGIEIK